VSALRDGLCDVVDLVSVRLLELRPAVRGSSGVQALWARRKTIVGGHAIFWKVPQGPAVASLGQQSDAQRALEQRYGQRYEPGAPALRCGVRRHEGTNGRANLASVSRLRRDSRCGVACTMPIMISFAPAPIFDMGGDHGRHGGARRGREDTPAAAPRKNVSPELVSRFRALIEDVTDELMGGQDLDRSACRADAIALLMATNEQFEGDDDGVESPLRYLLLEEQAKAAAIVREPDDRSIAFMKV
jgi:hypothetical protein